jgi:general secretion pathway protein G
MIVMGIIATLAAIAVPTYTGFIYRARIIKAVSDIAGIGKAIRGAGIDSGIYPMSLADVEGEDFSQVLDPWGNPYQYLNIAQGGPGKGAVRKDKFLVPLNTDFDLYSMGRDGESTAPLTAKASRDDIIRANNGGYVGRAVDY